MCISRLFWSAFLLRQKLWALILVWYLLLASTSQAGWIEDAPGKTIIHITVCGLPDPENLSADAQGTLKALDHFINMFFSARYEKKYLSDPKRYGKHNWKNVQIRLHPFTGIQVEGVETDLLAIAGGVAPDVLYVNFRKSDTYIQNGFLYPLDLPQDNYLTSMSSTEKEFYIYRTAAGPFIRYAAGNRGVGFREGVVRFVPEESVRLGFPRQLEADALKIIAERLGVKAGKGQFLPG